MKYFFSALLIFGFIGFSFSQPNLPKEKADSLWSVWEDESLPDTARLQAIYIFAWDGYLYTQPDSAFHFSQLQYNLAKEKEKKNYMAKALNTQGASFEMQYFNKKAIEYYTKSLHLQEEIGNNKGASASLNNIGNIFYIQSDYDKALNYYKRSLNIDEKIESIKGMASSLNNIGSIYADLGDNAKALDYYTKSLALKEEIADNQGIALSLYNIAMIYSGQGDYDKAIDYYTRSLNIDEEMGNKNGIASSLNNIGLIFYSRGEFDKAFDYYKRSLKIDKEAGFKQGVANTFINIGNIHYKQGEYTEAIDYYFKSLKIEEEIENRKNIASSLNNIGTIYEKQGEYTKSLEYNNQSLTLAKEIGAFYEIKSASRSLFITNCLANHKTAALKHLSKLRLLLETEIKTNFFTLPENEKQLYFSTMEADYGLYHDFALNYQDQFDKVTDTSYNIALQNKGITLKSSTAMRQSIQESGDTTLIKNYESWLSLKKKIANTNTQDSTYQSLTDQASELERQLVKESNTFNDFDQMMNLKWQDVQAGLKDQEAAIEFVHFKSEIDTTHPTVYAALIVKKESQHPAMIRLCTEADLTEILGSLQGNNLSFVNGVYGTREKAQTGLYDAIWKPLEPSLKDIENVYISPSGVLHKVAFHSLSKDQNVFLCDTYKIRQFNTTGALVDEQSHILSQDNTFLVTGGIKYNTDTTYNDFWSYLPATLDETQQIRTILEKKKYSVNYLSSTDADETAIKEMAPKANIIHIATHGFFFPDPEKIREELQSDEEDENDLVFRGNTNAKNMKRSTRYANWTFVKNKNPLMRSGIVLANANDVWQRPALKEGEDGVLTANEVSTLNLKNTDLVVLSACETGLGDIRGSEGVYGLRRAFKMAGAKYTIMSLWQVPDKETAEFMKLFYKNLTKLKDIPTAFEKTRAVMRKKHDPYYWAAFVLVE